MRESQFIRVAMVLFLAIVFTNCTPKDGVHKGTFNNRTRQQAKDLHIVFSREGVTYDAAESKTPMTSHAPVSANGKTQIDLDGDINHNSSAFKQVFKCADGDFDVERWWWTTKQDGESVRLGDEHAGPPNKDDGSGDWK